MTIFVDMRRDDDVRNPRHALRLLDSAHLAQHSGAADGQHEDARGGALTREIARAAQSVRQQQLLESDAHTEAQSAATQPTDRSRGDFHDAWPLRRQA